MTGRRPIAGLPLRLRAWQSRTLLNATSDGDGRFLFSDVPRGAVTIVPAVDAGYSAPCPSGTDVLNADATFDVHVVANQLLSTEGAPVSFPRTTIWISGVVFEKTAGGQRPVGSAYVYLAASEASTEEFSSTLSDAAGRYLVCTAPPGVGTDQESWIGVRKVGYATAGRIVLPGWDYDGANVELVPLAR